MTGPLAGIVVADLTLNVAGLATARDPRFVDNPARVGNRKALYRVPLLLGEHTAEILGALGYSAAEIERLAAGRIVQVTNGR